MAYPSIAERDRQLSDEITKLLFSAERCVESGGGEGKARVKRLADPVGAPKKIYIEIILSVLHI